MRMTRLGCPGAEARTPGPGVGTLGTALSPWQAVPACVLPAGYRAGVGLGTAGTHERRSERGVRNSTGGGSTPPPAKCRPWGETQAFSWGRSGVTDLSSSRLLGAREHRAGGTPGLRVWGSHRWPAAPGPARAGGCPRHSGHHFPAPSLTSGVTTTVRPSPGARVIPGAGTGCGPWTFCVHLGQVAGGATPL